MAASLVWKVYDNKGAWQAACKEIDGAAAVCSLYGIGSTIRHGHTFVVWTEGQDGKRAADSYDVVANTAKMLIGLYERRTP